MELRSVNRVATGRATEMKAGASMRARLLLGAAASVLMTASAFAGGFAIREQSATGQGASFAGVAAGSGGLSSMFWNPATITNTPGWNSEWHASLIIPYGKMTPQAGSGPLVATRGDSGNIGIEAFVPASYSSYQLNEQFWIGLSSNSPFGLRSKPNQNWSGQFYGRSSEALTINLSPTIGYKVNDWLSIGVGLQAQYFSTTLKRSSPTAPGAAGLPTAFLPGAPSAILDGDDIGFGYTAGVTIKPFAGTEIGVGFRSMIEHSLSGTQLVGTTATPIKADIFLPEMLSVGFRSALTPEFTLLGTAEWTNWSRLKEPRVISTATGTVINALPFRYDDGWFFSLGGEYKFSPQLTLRAGLGYELSPIGDDVRNVRIPDNDRLWASIGASYQYNEKIAFDIGYTHLFVKDPNVRIVPGHPDFVTPAAQLIASGEASIDIISVALKYRWDTPEKKAAPLVRKF